MSFLFSSEFLTYFAIPFLIALTLGLPVIKALKHFKSVQAFRELGPQSHIVEKIGTPTMGSWIFVIPFLVLAVYYYFSADFSKVFSLQSSPSLLEPALAKKYILISILAFIAAFILGLAMML